MAETIHIDKKNFKQLSKSENKKNLLFENNKKCLFLAQKTKMILYSLLKPIILLACLYFFICSLELMSSAFRLIGGKY
jgi:hypothetical protein